MTNPLDSTPVTPAPSPQATPSTGSPAGFRLFAVFLAFYLLAHEGLLTSDWVLWHEPAVALLTALTCAAALALLWKPGSLVRLLLLAGSAGTVIFYHLPFLPNHIFFTMMLCLTILLPGVYRLIRPETGYSASASAFRLFAPLIRIELLILYFWVVVHKLNWDYFNPEVSCGALMYFEVVDLVHRHTGLMLPSGDWTRYPSLLGALAFEALIPLMLLFRKTRLAGLFVGMGFHMMLGLHHNNYVFSFTLMMFACYTLFLPNSTATALVQSFEQGPIGRALRGKPWLFPAVTLLLMAGYLGAVPTLGSALSISAEQGLGPVYETVNAKVFIAISMLWTGSVFALLAWRVILKPAVRAFAVGPEDRWRLPHQWGWYAIPVVVFINSYSPYFGFKQHTSLAMFSNLRTEMGISNHMFIPSWPRLSDLHDRAVRVLESSNPRVPPSQPHNRWPVSEFTRQVMLGPPDAVYVVSGEDGETLTLTGAEALMRPEFEPEPWWARKLFWNKMVPDADRPCACRH